MTDSLRDYLDRVRPISAKEERATLERLGPFPVRSDDETRDAWQARVKAYLAAGGIHPGCRCGLAIDLNEIRRALKLEAAPLEQMREDVVAANEQAGLGVADFINAALVLEAIGGAIWVAVSRS